MQHRPTQFGLRENTASSRQHAQRFATETSSNAVRAEDKLPVGALETPQHAASEHAATGEGENGREPSPVGSRCCRAAPGTCFLGLWAHA
jgi:hypothetical protein